MMPPANMLGAVFRPQEDAQGYFLLLRQITERHGRPLALYRDRHTIFEGQKKKLTIEEQLQGRRFDNVKRAHPDRVKGTHPLG